MIRWVRTNDNIDLFVHEQTLPRATIRIMPKVRVGSGKKSRFGRTEKLISRYKVYEVVITATGDESSFKSAVKAIQWAEQKTFEYRPHLKSLEMGINSHYYGA